MCGGKCKCSNKKWWLLVRSKVMWDNTLILAGKHNSREEVLEHIKTQLNYKLDKNNYYLIEGVEHYVEYKVDIKIK